MILCEVCGNFTFEAFTHEYGAGPRHNDVIREWMTCKVCENRIRMDDFVKLVDDSITAADGEEVENSPISCGEGRKAEDGVKLTCLPEAADDVSRSEGSDIPRSLSKQEMRELQEQVYLLPCNNCGNTDDAKFSYVCDETDGAILCRYCEVCRGYFGADDSMGLNQLLQLLQSGLLKTTRCQCGNDDVEKFVFDEVHIGDGKSIVLKCTVCENETDVVDEDDIDVSSAGDDVETPGDTQEDALANLMLQMKKTKELKEQAACQCDSIDPAHYNVYLDMYGRVSKVECTNCDQTYTPVKDKQSYGDDNLDPPARTRIRAMADLKPGDHIAWHQSLGYWHHAIIVNMEQHSTASKLLVIEYSGPVKAGPPKFIGGVIVEHWINLNCITEELYRIEYKNSNPPDVVVTKARTRLGEAKYNLLTNNCEHFARWCKTNHHRSTQVESFAETLGRWGRASIGFATKFVFKSATKYLTKDAIPNAGTVAMDTLQLGNMALAGGGACAEEAYSTCSKANKALGWVGMGTLIAIEGISCVRDIREAGKHCRQGQIDRREFLNVVVKRVTQGAGGVVGTAVGGNVGQAVIPLPVVGGLVGCTLGYFLGQALGSLVGRKSVRLIEAIPEANVAVKYLTE